MRLFGDPAGPHLAHMSVHRHQGSVELEWELRNVDLRWRVLRSVEGFAATPEPPGSNGQRLLNESRSTFLKDADVNARTHYYYTVFSQEADGTWQRQVEAEVRPRDVLKWLHPQVEDIFEAEKSLHSMPTPGSRGHLQPRHLSRTDVEEWRNSPGRHGGRLVPSNLGQRDVDQWLSIGGD